MRYSAIIIPNPDGTYAASIECGGRVQRLYQHHASYADAKENCEHTIEVKQRNAIRRGFERLVDAVAPKIAAVPTVAELEQHDPERWDGMS